MIVYRQRNLIPFLLIFLFMYVVAWLMLLVGHWERYPACNKSDPQIPLVLKSEPLGLKFQQNRDQDAFLR